MSPRSGKRREQRSSRGDTALAPESAVDLAPPSTSSAATLPQTEPGKAPALHHAFFSTLDTLAATHSIPGLSGKRRAVAPAILETSLHVAAISQAVEEQIADSTFCQNLMQGGSDKRAAEQAGEPVLTDDDRAGEAHAPFSAHLDSFLESLDSTFSDTDALPPVCRSSDVAVQEMLAKTRELYKAYARRLAATVRAQHDHRRAYLSSVAFRQVAAAPCVWSSDGGDPAAQASELPTSLRSDLDDAFVQHWNRVQGRLQAQFTIWLQQLSHAHLARKEQSCLAADLSSPAGASGTTPRPSPSQDTNSAEQQLPDAKFGRKLIFTPSVLRVLNASYANSSYLSSTEKSRLAQVCGLTVKQVGVWFTNKRSRDRKDYTIATTLTAPTAEPPGPGSLAQSAAPAFTTAIRPNTEALDRLAAYAEMLTSQQVAEDCQSYDASGNDIAPSG
ncbi:GS homeobox 1 [Sorochytrium milnesiophthora]